MFLYYRLLFIIVLLAGPSELVLAQFDLPLGQREQVDKSAETRELVSKYCRLDYEGARLNAPDWSKLQPLVWWKTNPDYTQMDIVTRYTVEGEPSSNRGKYNVTVQYRTLGIFDLVAGYVSEPANSVQEVNYTVSAVNGEWRILDADNTMPHPSRPAMIKWLNSRISGTTDAAARKIYEDALRQLQTPGATPAP